MIPRMAQREVMIDFLTHFDAKDVKRKKCVYVYGPSGCGKTTFVKQVLQDMNYDMVCYGAGDVRNKSIMDGITVNNMASSNIMSCFTKTPKKLAIIMDEIDCMNNGDRGGINSLIKLIRPKKTKRQLVENITHIPIICIGNASQDKKIKELMKYSVTLEFKHPSPYEMHQLLLNVVPRFASMASSISDLNYVRQLLLLQTHGYQGDPSHVLCTSLHEDSKDIVKRILNVPNMTKLPINDANRTIISLMWHENIIDLLQQMDPCVAIPLYVQILDEICFADYIDRITFQKQLWMFNELSFKLKPFYTNYLFQRANQYRLKVDEVRFTKVLTKYSTEYNNNGFLQKLCSELSMDKADLFVHLQLLAQTHTDMQIAAMYAHTSITLLDVQRIYRYISKNNV